MNQQTHLEAVSPAVRALAARGNVTWDEYENLALNGFERDLLYPHLTTEALCNAAEQFRQHCLTQRHFPPVTYDEALMHRLVPLLLQRLRAYDAAARHPLTDVSGACRQR